MSFESVQLRDPLKAEDVQRFQQNVSNEFSSLETPVAVPVQVVQWSASSPTYTVKPADVYIVVNSRPGPMKIVLPVPARATQSVQILNGFVGNKVTIVQSDAGALGNGLTLITLAAESTAHMVTDGKAWYRFGL